MPVRAACFAVEVSYASLYSDSIFVKQEDLFDRTVVFISEKPLIHGAWVLGEKEEGGDLASLPHSEQMGSEQGPSTSPAKMPQPWQLSQDTDNGV